MMRRVCFVATLWVTLVTATNLTAVTPPKYVVTDLGSLGGGSTTVAALNAVGEVTGSSLTAVGLRHAFLYSRGVMTDLGTLAPGASTGTSDGLSINNAGQVSGNSTYLPDTNPDSRNNLHVFLHSAGVMTDVGTLLGEDNFTRTGGLNDSGQITGTGSFAGAVRAFLYSGGSVKDLGVPQGFVSSGGDFINAVGQVSGTACCTFEGTSQASHAFLYSDGVMHDLGALGGSLSFSLPTGLNDAGQVIGESESGAPGSSIHAFLYHDGAMRDLGTLGGPGSFASAINAAGQITGYAVLANGQTHAFLYDARAEHPVMMDLGTFGNPDLSTSYGFAINTAGQIAGGSQDGSGDFHAFLYRDGIMYDLNNLIPAGSGWTLSQGVAINDLARSPAMAASMGCSMRSC